MSRLSTVGRGKLNLEAVTVLLVDSNAAEINILSQIFSGFGVWSPHKCGTAGEAEDLIKTHEIDLVVVGTLPPPVDHFEFIKWLRMSATPPNRFVPIINVSGHTLRSNVTKARDFGANFVIAKPVTSQILWDRIAWLAKEERAFVESSSYVGPDRRFQKLGLPPGVEPRRSDDLPEEIGEATMPNLSQGDIDALFSPKKA